MSENDINPAAVLQELETLPMGELRKRAAKVFAVKCTTDMTKKDVIKAIKEKLTTADYAQPATGDAPKPGWARITLHHVPGTSRHPEPCSVNNYVCYIPKNSMVDVPTKVVEMLRDNKRLTLMTDEEEAENSKNRYYWDEAEAYPMTVHMITDGPDPRPGHEVKKERLLAPYRAYFEEFGIWPKPKQLQAAIESGLLKNWNKNKLLIEATA